MTLLDSDLRSPAMIMSIRSIEIRFDIIKLKDDNFILYRDGVEIGQLKVGELRPETRSKLRSLAEHRIDGKHRH